MQTALAVLFCLSPALMLGLGYYLGRFGSPVVLRFQARRDRRQVVEAPAVEPDSVEVYTAADRPPLTSYD